ncbi:methylenetetrahydrofolate reductase [NAD(P)H] [Flavonifractor sp. An100]|uniref:methylenetetrahydrofolate reductase [NAD(P)H] n=1 Tax=Flavonifractor sp. An100 TaxID=1965538 RepID=UPI000B396D9A|nr:methylenetetrahydrofolate reductase [NAD(P)H] [Flavonifractor sp. An100]OUQ82265.1 methylenetetrahydrofolate reductase [NAD(P)H] [Flavonifractor sp. An100]
MKLHELFQTGKTVFSCEVFPPKKTSPVDSIYKTLDGLKDIQPDFISVTFGAGGSQVNQTTREIAAIIQNQYHIPAMAHLTCVAAGREEVDGLLAGLKADGVENVLALRGDVNPSVPPKTDFLHANELVSYIRSTSDFGVSAACYPEGHLESPDLVSDIRYLKAKVDAGAQHLVSQLFFDNEDFFRFLERCRIAGITVPIEAGIMPVLSASSIQRMVSLCGASLPRKLTRLLGRYGDHPQALREAGIAYAIDQISDLIAGGVDGIHLYTMNNPDVARQIAGSLSSIRSL